MPPEDLMRVLLLVVGLFACVSPAFAQSAAPRETPAPKLFVPAAELAAMIAKAKAERRPDQPNYVQPILRLVPYVANLEHRVAGLNANATVHEKDAEMFYVIEGAGTLVTGGTLREERRTNAD